MEVVDIRINSTGKNPLAQVDMNAYNNTYHVDVFRTRRGGLEIYCPAIVQPQHRGKLSIDDIREMRRLALERYEAAVSS